MTVVPLACRFVPYDQWFLTHLDDTSKVKHVKHWLLSKSNLLHDPGPGPLSLRSVSPITFAPSIRTRSSQDSLDDGYHEDDEHSDQDLPAKPRPSPSRHAPLPTPQLASSPLVDQYILISFSTGSILEDEFPLSWYNLRPFELLEIHPVGTIAPLQRDVLAEYVRPYFQARVRLLRAVWNHKSGRFEVPSLDPQRDYSTTKAKDKFANTLDSLSPKSATSHSEKRRKTKAEWKARWVVIGQGVLSLCKGHVANPPLQQFPLSTMRALRGADALERTFSIVAEPRIVCIKFRPRPPFLSGVASPPPSLPASPISPRTNVHEPLDSPPNEYAHDLGDAHEGEGEWIVLDMLDDHAFSSIVRILHRQASYPIASSFVPSSSIIAVSNSLIPSPSATSFASYDTIPYPEWRIHTVENARKAGMGDVGKPMAWVIWTEKGLGDSVMGNIRHHRQAFSREMQYKANVAPSNIYAGSGEDSDDESEMEWEGWMRDLERQRWVKHPDRSAVSEQAHTPTSSALPSPPLSETSPTGSPRVRSPSLSYTQFPTIVDLIQAGGAHGSRSTEHPHLSDKMKSSTISSVSVGKVPFSRRRSSTLTAEMATPKRDHDKGKQDREVVPSIRGARTLSTSAGHSRSPRTVVRQVHSSSNLRISSYGSDAPESLMYPGPSSPSKRQNAFMRGMSLGAGKIVRGLESAIDFVDEKTT